MTDNQRFEIVQQKLGYRYSNVKLLKLALTHKSYAYETNKTNNDELIKKTKKTIWECVFVALNISIIYFAMKRATKYKKIEMFNLRQIRKAKLPVPSKDFSLKPFI